ncbi:sigma-70 family RNA polymerase sigma factor [Neorhizobium alkalisoli]|uniref:RNA polymerase sigma-70 factor (ECF subfamily) n=1 Tax=Neorhizobium alkalisoli TaxID=528178 RepID=A0A561QBQ4_9HYPH|nr:sigma-70 family RNA polymerase sigma factor [Neorhizobium alkalisoli]TWF47799.1 RNA polymerase sigma-70 factor (ECF subfamily) [Neorhizobium alkalisoli]
MAVVSSSGFSHADMLDEVPALRAFARRFHQNGPDAEDLVQDTLMRALANSDKFRAGTKLRSWMFTIMRNRFCTKFASSKREMVGIDDDASGRMVTQPTQEWSLRGHELEQAISKLPRNQSDALVMVLIDALSYEDAATQLGCAIGTIKSRVNRARHQLAISMGHAD